MSTIIAKGIVTFNKSQDPSIEKFHLTLVPQSNPEAAQHFVIDPIWDEAANEGLISLIDLNFRISNNSHVTIFVALEYMNGQITEPQSFQAYFSETELPSLERGSFRLN